MSDLDELFEAGECDEQEHDGEGRIAQLDELFEFGDPAATPEPQSSDEDEDLDPTGINALVEMGAAPQPARKYQRRGWELLQHARDRKEVVDAEAAAEGKEHSVEVMGRALLWASKVHPHLAQIASRHGIIDESGQFQASAICLRAFSPTMRMPAQLDTPRNELIAL